MRKKGIIFFLSMAVVVLALAMSVDSRTPASRNRERTHLLAGTTWSTPVNVSNTPDESWSPQIAADAQGKAYVVWTEWYSGGRNICFNTNKSGQWGNAQVFHVMNATNDDAGFPVIIAESDGTCHVVLHDIPVENFEILHYEYTNNWGGRYNVSQSNGGTAYASLSLSPADNYLYVVWQDSTLTEYDIMYRFRSPSPDKQWKVVDTIPLQFGAKYMPSLAIDGKGTAHVVYYTRGMESARVFYTKNPEPQDNTKWISPISISGPTGVDWCFSKVACDNAGEAYVIWVGLNNNGNYDIFFRQTVNQAWEPIKNLSNSDDKSEAHTIAVNKTTGEIYVAWQEYKGGTDWEIYLMAYEEVTPGGKKEWYEKPLNLTNNSKQQGEPSLAITEKGDVHLAYLERDNNVEIMYTYKEKIKVYPPTNVALQTIINKLLFHDEKINRITFSKNSLNDESNLDKYELYRRKDTETDDKFQSIATLAASTFSYDNRKLPLNEKYAYVLKAVDKQGNKSEYSTIVTEQ